MITMQEVMRLAKDKSRTYTAQEWQDVLLSCPEWVAEDAARKAKHETAVRIQAEAVKPEQDPILKELSAVGHPSESVWTLVNLKAAYPAAIPVLVKYFPLVTHPVLREGIARALTVREAQGQASVLLLDALKNESDAELRWVFANALTVVAERKDAVAIEALLADRAYEDVSERLGEALKKLKS